MKNHKLKAVLFFIVSLCAFMLAAGSESVYLGPDFDYNLTIIIFNILSFCCLSTLVKTKSDCMLKNNMITLLKINSRKKAMWIEICIRLRYVLLFVLLQVLLVILFEFLSGNPINVFLFLSYFAANGIILSFFMIMQLSLDLFVNSNFGYLSINVIYIVCLLSGQMMFDYYNYHKNALSSVLKVLNNMNIVNYLSLPRSEQLCIPVLLAELIALLLLLLLVFIMIRRIKSFDFLSED